MCRVSSWDWDVSFLIVSKGTFVSETSFMGNKYVSLGGRIVLLNSVLNSIPIFYLSFLKLSARVWRKIVIIQRQFLWGGNKISWVKWTRVCQPKSNCGLGVRDVRVVNLSLLAKWRWILIQNEKCMW